MKVLITGAKGFVGKNLVKALEQVRDGKDRRERYQTLLPLTIFEYDRDSNCDELAMYCAEADFVFNLAGVNRPKEQFEFMEGNFGFASELLDALAYCKNACPVMLASSAQASLEGRFAGGEYGKSKLAGEKLFHEYSEKTGAPVLIYRFPNLYGKWCKPNYNSAVATFCNNIANNLPITVNDPSVELELLYIDDLVREMMEALLGNETRIDGGFCQVGPTDHVTLGEIASLLEDFKAARNTLGVPDVTAGTFSKKLYSTYLSYLDTNDFSYKLKMNKDERGSFTELLRTIDRGQLSVNVSKPGITKGQHWHNTKWEKFCVVSGKGLIQLRRVGTDVNGELYPSVEYHVTGNNIEVVEMIPGYTHNIINLSNEHDLVTVMWCNECFDPENPDTFYEEV
ncbi:MAG: NAD-dependent epimerase/dehydratase family protein [Raoultibacter sp.]